MNEDTAVTQDGVTQLTVYLDKQADRAMEEQAARSGWTRTDVVNDALVGYAELQLLEPGEVLVQTGPGGNRRGYLVVDLDEAGAVSSSSWLQLEVGVSWWRRRIRAGR